MIIIWDSLQGFGCTEFLANHIVLSTTEVLNDSIDLRAQSLNSVLKSYVAELLLGIWDSILFC